MVHQDAAGSHSEGQPSEPSPVPNGESVDHVKWRLALLWVGCPCQRLLRRIVSVDAACPCRRSGRVTTGQMTGFGTSYHFSDDRRPVATYRLAPGVLDALQILKPHTVIRWHRAGFRAYSRWKSRPHWPAKDPCPFRNPAITRNVHSRLVQVAAPA